MYFKETFYPFKKFVNDLYTKRLKFKKEKSPMAYVTKILMNSLYGKFAQKFQDLDTWVHESNVDMQLLEKAVKFERVHDWFRFGNQTRIPAAFCFPIIAAYTTAYARDELHKLLVKANAVYCDTDSIITRKSFPETNELGGLKCEGYINGGVICRPKTYMLTGNFEGKKYKCAIKGIGKRVHPDEFMEYMRNPIATYHKFIKWKEAKRRNLIVNERVEILKHLNLEDDKRIWDEPFNHKEFQISKPFFIDMDIIKPKILKTVTHS